MSKSYERGDVRRPQILEAALTLISEGGLHTVTTRRIAERVGLSEAALFRHFPDKQAILEGCLDHLESLMFPGHDQIPNDALSRLEHFFLRRVALVAGPTALGHLVFSEQLVHATGELGRRRVVQWRTRSAAQVGAMLAEIAAMGRLRPGLTPQMCLPVIQGQVLGFVADRVVAPLRPGALETRANEAWQLLTTLLFVPG